MPLLYYQQHNLTCYTLATRAFIASKIARYYLSSIQRSYILGLSNIISQCNNNIYTSYSVRFTSACLSKFFWYIFCAVPYSLVANGANLIYTQLVLFFQDKFLTPEDRAFKLCIVIPTGYHNPFFWVRNHHAQRHYKHSQRLWVFTLLKLFIFIRNVCKRFGNKK